MQVDCFDSVVENVLKQTPFDCPIVIIRDFNINMLIKMN